MDILHEKRIEIVSPSFMNQRRVDKKEFIPRRQVDKLVPQAESIPEELVFDEAIKSEKIEKKKDFLKELDGKLELMKEDIKELDDPNEIEKVKSNISKNEELKERIEQSIKDQTERNSNNV